MHGYLSSAHVMELFWSCLIYGNVSKETKEVSEKFWKKCETAGQNQLFWPDLGHAFVIASKPCILKKISLSFLLFIFKYRPWKTSALFNSAE